MGEDPVVRSVRWRGRAAEPSRLTLEEAVRAIERAEDLIWLDAADPPRATAERLAEAQGLGPHAVEDATSPGERPKTVVDDDTLVVVAATLTADDGGGSLRRGQITCLSSRHALVTVRLDSDLDMDAVQERWRDHVELVDAGPLGLVHGILDRVVDDYLDLLRELDRRADRLSDDLFGTADLDTGGIARRTFALRRDLTAVRREVAPMRDAVSSLRAAAERSDAEAVLRPYFDDLQDHVDHAHDTTVALIEAAGSVLDAAATLTSDWMNRVMKRLTAWAAIIAVPTAITGFYGQNVPYPGSGRGWGFATSALLTLVVVVPLYVGFRRKHWL